MSDFNLNLGGFNPNDYKNNGTGTKSNQRMAGDYLKDFGGGASNVGKMLSGKDLRGDTRNNSSQAPVSNVNKVLFGDSGKPPEKATAAKTAAKPAAKPAASTGVIGGIDYGAMADARMATATEGEKNGGVNREYWINKYKENNAEYEQNKALMASHTGPKTWDELGARSKAREGKGDTKSRNTESIADYNAYTKYATAKQNADGWEKSTAKYRN